MRPSSRCYVGPFVMILVFHMHDRIADRLCNFVAQQSTNQSSMHVNLFSFNLNSCNDIGKTDYCFPVQLPPRYFEIHLWNLALQYYSGIKFTEYFCIYRMYTCLCIVLYKPPSRCWFCQILVLKCHLSKSLLLNVLSLEIMTVCYCYHQNAVINCFFSIV
jgi:hypothetical protein